MAIVAPSVNIENTAKALLENYYLVRIPYLQTTSVDYMRLVGTYITGDREIDKTLANQWITTMLNISKMVEYYGGGAQIRIVKQSDVKEIYEHISAYLEAWLNQLTYGVNIYNAPIDNLLIMDKFANEIYEHAKYHFTPNSINSVLINKLANTSTFNASNFFTNVDLSKKTNDSSDITKINSADDIPERESLADYLKEHLYKLKRWN